MNLKKGFSLLELVLAIAIFSLGAVSLATLLIDSNISTKLSIERTEALLYAKEGVGAVRTIRDADWDSVIEGEYGLEYTDGSWAFSEEPDLIDSKYTRTVTIEDSATSTKNVSVNVSWEPNSSRVSSTTIDTIITDWQM